MSLYTPTIPTAFALPTAFADEVAPFALPTAFAPTAFAPTPFALPTAFAPFLFNIDAICDVSTLCVFLNIKYRFK